AELGLHIPPLFEETRRKLTCILGQVGSILRNPVDVSQSGSNPDIIREALGAVLADSAIDLVIIQEDAGILLKYFPLEWVQDINTVFVDFRANQEKPIVVVSPPGASDLQRLEIERRLTQASIPVFPTMERAAKAIANLSSYYRMQEASKS
ncbi:MAG: hypothetical protein JXB43_03330, partial [Dehalococcoidia bacterium]|nr:hypothetical protein [Dehalococcoidia bacterium]